MDDAVASLDAHLLGVMFSKYQLRRHLDAIKRYLLLGQGDFVETLMGLVGAELDRPVRLSPSAGLAMQLLQATGRYSNTQVHAGE